MAAGALTLIALCAFAQYVSIYLLNHVIFTPQLHFDFYRLNGIAGWPHFLNIFSFLLLPIVILDRHLPVATKLILALLLFVLVQSTAKTGWVLFIVFGILLLIFSRQIFLQNYVFFLVPVAIFALLIPAASLGPASEVVSTTEKVAKFAADLDITNKTTSGTDRMLINEMGLDVWSLHPWFGVGPKAYRTYVWSRLEREMPDAAKFEGDRTINAKNENIWIEFLAENGALFTAGFIAIIVWALWMPRRAYRNPLALGTWMALIMYFAISGQVSQNGLLTLVYAVFGIHFYARGLPDGGDTST